MSNEEKILELLREYFRNKEQQKINKEARKQLWESKTQCTGSHYEDCGEGSHHKIMCIEALVLDPKNTSIELCEWCNARNVIHKAIKKLVLRNSAIIKSLKALSRG